MLLSEAMRSINPGELKGVVRAGDRLLWVNRRLALKMVGKKGMYDFRATYADLVATDWQIVELEGSPNTPPE